MSVRRLAPQELQPASFAFTSENEAWVEKQIAKYPPGRQASAVIPLLWKAQEQAGGWVSQAAIEVIAARLGMAKIRVLEIATFYTMFNLEPVGKYFIQLCGTTPCQLRGAEAIRDVVKKRVGPERHVTADGNFSWLEVECLGACCNAPMVQINADFYEDLTPEIMERIIDDLAAGKEVKPGPQNGRFSSEPEGGAQTLNDPALYDGSVIGSWKKRFEEEKAKLEAAKAEAAKAEAAKAAGTPPPPAPATTAAPAPAAPVPAPVSDDHKPVLLKAAREGGPDDLKLIHGVGPKLEEMLHQMGVYHFDQIAAWNDSNLAWVDQNLGAFKGRALRDGWIEQAKKLATGWRPENPAGEKLD
ncbi:NADH-quinone oxidoreductase subunit NuoE [Labrys portucalensis]|uniref:NADH-quinone oxidoreductase subunit NuoE n=1 Tax=Labrys neptuniae TaxID=376174 RepID=A0ABV6ZAJ0_9HYPH